MRAQTDGIWVSGLPDEARIITVGQGFVNDGERVDPKDSEETEETAVRETVAALPDTGPDAEAQADAQGGAQAGAIIDTSTAEDDQ